MTTWNPHLETPSGIPSGNTTSSGGAEFRINKLPPGIYGAMYGSGCANSAGEVRIPTFVSKLKLCTCLFQSAPANLSLPSRKSLEVNADASIILKIFTCNSVVVYLIYGNNLYTWLMQFIGIELCTNFSGFSTKRVSVFTPAEYVAKAPNTK